MLSSLVSLLLSIQTLLPGHKMSPFRLSNGAFPPPPAASYSASVQHTSTD